MTALFSFLGGSIFRMIWGELSSYFSKQQEHKQEVERMKLQGELDAAQHSRNLEAIKVQADLGIKTIQVQAEADIGRIEADAFLSVVNATSRSIGVVWIDAWNAVIRPGVATWSVVMLTLAELTAYVMSDNATQVCSAALGIYLADRTLMKRSK